MFNLLKDKKGITLIALVVTIVVLLILAGITIVYVLGDNGVLVQAQKSADATKLGQIKEQIGLWKYDNKMSNVVGEKAKSLKDFLDELVDKKLLTASQVETILNNSNNEITLYGEVVSFKPNTNNEYTLGTAGNPYNYLDLIGTAVQTEYTITVNDLTLQVGDFVAYTPNGTSYLKTDMDNYSGNTDNTDLTPESLQWRIFDVKDNKIRLVAWNGTYIGTKNGKIKLGYGTEDEGNNEARWDRKCYGI